MAGPLRVERDVSVAAWLADALSWESTLAVIVPPIFDAYARILHPATLQTPTGRTDAWGGPELDARDLRWDEAAALVGERQGESPFTAWEARFGSGALDLPDGRSITEPHLGDIPVGTLAHLAALLVDEHGDAEVLAAVWEGSGLDQSGIGWMFFPGPGEPPLTAQQERALEAEHRAAFEASIDPEVRAAMAERALLQLPGRDHVLLRGRLEAFADPAWERAAGLGWRPGVGGEGRTPNALWPAEPPGAPAWFVATDVDLDVTLVGGSAHLIGRVLGHPALEAERIRPTDPLV
ncbi:MULTISPECIES: hypothetical protein [Agrococcus]|uniref:Uncharacterized protein n=1 Tax=Agrococcus pavilionensis RW1 TaxID=1330458 RepID=U1LRU8_9MICO|nr:MULTISPECIES: hypothetical protein [Agrococcus]ERG65229.1 hypothetical protein L332_12370 [Agrococcus pavilionensis RW1]MBO1770014.1 hypothetical protein [Agrococcus sp. TF02-05]